MKSFHKISEQLTLALTLEDIKVTCEHFCKEIGFEYFIFAVCKATSLSAPQIRTITNYPPPWLKTYFEEGMQKHDPVVKYCFKHTTPIRWDQLLLMEEYIDAAGLNVMRKGAEAGLGNGFSIPLKAPSGEVAIYSLATNNDSEIDDRMLSALPYSHLFGTRLFEAFSKIQSPESESSKYNLTAREVECLFWACEGKTTWEMSKIINITERTIIFHLTSATKKLGAANRQHAVAKALICGLIKATP